MSETPNYKYLEPRPGSHYRQWFVKGRRIRAEVLYRETIGDEPRTPEEIAEDYGVPVEAVTEAIDYCLRNQPVLREDWEREEANYQADRRAQATTAPPDGRAAS